MSKSETEIQRESLARANEMDGVQMYRNNTGALKVGSRFVKFGLCKGSSDLIGYTEREITADMIGSTVAVFTAIEMKKPGGKTTFEQVEFGDKVMKAGGIFGVAESVEDTIDILEGE